MWSNKNFKIASIINDSELLNQIKQQGKNMETVRYVPDSSRLNPTILRVN